MAAPRMCPEEVAPDVYRLGTGHLLTEANVYLVRAADGWCLIDTAWPVRVRAITGAAESLFGAGTPPAAILLTHVHPDHSGAAAALAARWQVPVYVHRDELPFVGGGYQPEYAHPLDRRVVAPLLRVLPHRQRSGPAKGSLTGIARPLEADGSVPGLPEWECVPTPGHTAGHVAFLRPGDGVLISGDAVVAKDLNSLAGFFRAAPRVSGPPRYTTWNWERARASVEALAARDPRLLAPGHGRPTPISDAALHRLAADMGRAPRARDWILPRRDRGPSLAPSRPAP